MRKTIKAQNLITSITLLIIISCTPPAVDENTVNKIAYDNLIFNTALNSPYYHYDQVKYGDRNEPYAIMKTDLTGERKIVRDDSLGLEFSMHTYRNANGSLNQASPEPVISITDGDHLLFAFPFYDEYAYRSFDSIDSLYRYKQLEHTNLELQLNHIRQEMGWSTVKDKKKVNQFITLLTDSLLQLSEFTTKDTASLKKELLKSYEYSGLITPYPEIREKSINFLAAEAIKNDVRLFSLSDGHYAFWKFTIETDSSQHIFIRASIGN